MSKSKDLYRKIEGLPDDINHHKGLPMVDICMCINKSCPDARRCRRHLDSGTIPAPHYQSYALFNEKSKKACPQYWPHPHKHIEDKP